MCFYGRTFVSALNQILFVLGWVRIDLRLIRTNLLNPTSRRDISPSCLISLWHKEGYTVVYLVNAPLKQLKQIKDSSLLATHTLSLYWIFICSCFSLLGDFLSLKFFLSSTFICSFPLILGRFNF